MLSLLKFNEINNSYHLSVINRKSLGEHIRTLPDTPNVFMPKFPINPNQASEIILREDKKILSRIQVHIPYYFEMHTFSEHE
jgi:hypothetical protein